MRYLSLAEVLELHERVVVDSGGSPGLRDLSALEAAINQPKVSFGGKDLHRDVIAKAAALCYSLVLNHPFVDGYKRTGHAAMETFLILNGFELAASVSEQENAILDLAAGKLTRESLAQWVRGNTITI